MSGKLQGIRLSAELRALVDAAGPRLNPATRALLILGAHAAGQDVSALASTVHVLIAHGELRGGTVAALRRVMGATAITTDSSCDSSGDSSRDSTLAPTGRGDPLADPLAGVGIEV